jgi:hypothetical protein
MWNPDFLHRSKRMTIFPPGAGQSPDLGGLVQQNRVVAPPHGQAYNLIIHLDRIEDWSPPLDRRGDRTPSSEQSGHPSSGSSDSEDYPKIYDFED